MMRIVTCSDCGGCGHYFTDNQNQHTCERCEGHGTVPAVEVEPQFREDAVMPGPQWKKVGDTRVLRGNVHVDTYETANGGSVSYLSRHPQPDAGDGE